LLRARSTVDRPPCGALRKLPVVAASCLIADGVSERPKADIRVMMRPSII